MLTKRRFRTKRKALATSRVQTDAPDVGDTEGRLTDSDPIPAQTLAIKSPVKIPRVKVQSTNPLRIKSPGSSKESPMGVTTVPPLAQVDMERIKSSLEPKWHQRTSDHDPPTPPTPFHVV